MREQHLPVLGSRFWAALCLASIFGANMGDYFAHNIGLGHVAGLPILAVVFAFILGIERGDTGVRETYYWLAIIVVRTAATNIGDYLAGDLKLPRTWIMACLALALTIAVTFAWQARRGTASIDRRRELLRANGLYWVSMLIAGTLGTVMGDYFSHNLKPGDGLASIALGAPLALLFIVGSRGPIWSLPFYWVTIVAVRAAGTAVGDLTASRGMLGLPLSTAVTGIVFVALLLVWRGPRPSTAPVLGS
jgi:uncharacterized membrane-anchored protein